MRKIKSWNHLGIELAVVTAALTVTALSASNVSAAADSSVSGVIDHAQSRAAAVEPAAAETPPATTAGTTTVLFQQPTVTGIADYWYVANVSTGGLPEGVFSLVAWNPNIHNKTGEYVASTWDAGADTGFTPANLSTAQLSMQNKTGSTTAQMEGNVVGAYLNAKDLKAPATDQLMMISPQYIWPVGKEPKVYATKTSVFSSSLRLQIPTASGGDTFTSVDILFVDPNGVRLTFDVKLFDFGHEPNALGTSYDKTTSTFLFNCPLTGEPKFITQAPGSANGTDAPFVGWQTFGWSISQEQFAAMLKYLQSQYPGEITTTSPAKWLLSEVHLNAQFEVIKTPTVLGWSMSNWQVSMTN